MAVSPDGTKLAILVTMVPSTLVHRLPLNFNLFTEGALPVQLMWCGNGCITYLHTDQFPDVDDPRTAHRVRSRHWNNHTQIELATEAGC